MISSMKRSMFNIVTMSKNCRTNDVQLKSMIEVYSRNYFYAWIFWFFKDEFYSEN